jgi:hypothetical protein
LFTKGFTEVIRVVSLCNIPLTFEKRYQQLPSTKLNPDGKYTSYVNVIEEASAGMDNGVA